MSNSKNRQKQTLQGRTTRVIDSDTGEDVEQPSNSQMVDVKTNKRGAYVTDENPFLYEALQSLEVRKRLRTVARGTAYLIEDQTQLHTTVQQEEEIDQKRFVKIFSGPDYKDVYNLSPAGLKLYLVVLEILGDVSSMNKVHIRLTTQMAINLTAKSDFPLSTATANRGIKDLIEKGYIAAAEINGETNGWYWINPKRFFNGRTVELRKIYRVARENKVKQMQVELPL